MSRFLLIAPLAHEGLPESSALATMDVPGGVDYEEVGRGLPQEYVRLQSRRSYRPSFLVLDWEALPGAVLDPTADIPVTIHSSAMATSRGQHIFVAQAQVHELPRRSDGGVDIEALETMLTGAAAQAVHGAQLPHGQHVEWVARYQMLGPDEEPPPGWMPDDTTTAHMDAGCATAAVEVGWGNGSIRVTGAFDPADWHELVCGFIDSQIIWAELARLSDLSGDSFAHLYTNDARRRRRRREVIATVGEFTGLLGSHQLAYDDLLMNIQGIRQKTALATLGSWNYEGILHRVDRRLSDVQMVAENIRDRSERKYQELVQGALFGLAALTLLDLSIGLIGAAYSGGASDIPGSGSGLGIMEFLRAVNADHLLLTSGGAIVLALLLYISLRRR